MSGKLTKLRDVLENVVGNTAQKISNQKHISALMSGMLFTLPFTLIGGLALIIIFPPVPDTLNGTNLFFKFLIAWREWGASSEVFMIPYNLSLGLISIYTVIGIAYSLSKAYNLQAINTTVISLFVFLTIAAQPVSNEKLGLTLPMSFLDAKGMFSAILIAMLTVEITRFLLNKNIKIKMPASVPAIVTAPFEMLIPFLVNLVIFMSINQGLISLTGSGIVSFIQDIITPLLSATDSLPSVIIVNILVMGFWFFGIHGASILATIVGPIQASNLIENATSLASGEALPYVFAGSFKSIFATQIMYNALLIALLIFAKSPRLRSLTKVSFIPNLFNINEPILFGLPIVMNVILIIPVLITVVIDTAVFYLLMSADIVGKVYISIAPTIPAPINSYLTTMDWKAPVVWFILFFVNVLIFVPFVKMYDRQVMKEDSE